MTDRMRLALLLLALPLTLGARAPIDYVVRGDGIVAIRIGGQPAKLRINPWAPAAPTLNPDFVRRIGLHAGLFGFAVKVGPVKVKGDTSVTRLDFGTTSFRRRVVWFERPYDRGADAAVGPGGLPVDIVRFQLRPARPGERTVALPLIQKPFRPSYAEIRLADRKLQLLFDPTHDRTLATAGAGQAIAAALDGTLFGVPDKAEVAFGIDRPIRLMRLARPFMVGPLAVSTIAIRTGDNGSTAGIADADADPDEIVVSAKGNGDRRDTVIIGRDQLERCSSIVFDKPAKLIRLTCG